MVVLFAHGAAGGWDELAIAVAALAVLWVAVKLAGRKSVDDEEDPDAEPLPDLEEREEPASSSSSTLG
jgi:hypothetical protein